MRHKTSIIATVVLSLTVALAFAAHTFAAPVGAPADTNTPGVHSTDSAGLPVGPLSSVDQASRDAQSRAPKVSNPSPPATTCPTILGPDGPIDIIRGLFKYADGTMTNAVRVTGSNGHVYEIFAGGGRPTESGSGRAPDLDGRFVVFEYQSRTVDVCRDIATGSTGRIVISVDINPASGPASITGAGANGSVQFSTAQGRKGTFQPSTRVVS